MRRIVVGVDESPGARAALAWAVDEARQWGATLEAVLAWSHLVQPVEEFRSDFDEIAARELLDRLVDEVGTEGVPRVVRTTVNDLPARSVLHVARDADLIVVGARGLGGFKGLLLGSVSQQVASHSPCPVVIVRGH